MNILVVEDNQITQLIIQKYLIKWGYLVSMAESGEQALVTFQNQASDEKFKLILLDLQLPGLSGYETFTRIRQLDTQVPVLAMTASVHFEPGLHPVSYGMNDIVIKPFDPDQLKALLEKYTRRA